MKRLLLFPVFIIVILFWLPIELFINLRYAFKATWLWMRVEWGSFKNLTIKKEKSHETLRK